MQWVSNSSEELQQLAAQFAASLSPREAGATLVTLSGQLGAGKTTFTQGVAKALGVSEQVTSPTFVIEKIYALPPLDTARGERGFTRLMHIDAYRLEGAHQLDVLDWHALLADKGNLILLEWPERVASAIPDTATRLTFDIHGDERVISGNLR